VKASFHPEVVASFAKQLPIQVIDKLALVFNYSAINRLLLKPSNFKPFSIEIHHLTTFFFPSHLNASRMTSSCL